MTNNQKVNELLDFDINATAVSANITAKKRIFLIVAIVVLVFAIVCGSILLFVTSSYQKANDAEDSGNYASALTYYRKAGIFKDSKTKTKAMQAACDVIESGAYQTLQDKVNTTLNASCERASLAYDYENNAVIITQEQSADILDIEKFTSSNDPALLEAMLGVFTEMDQLTTDAKIAFKSEELDVNVRNVIKQTNSENTLYISENGGCKYSAVQIEDIKAKIYGTIKQFIDDKNYEDAIYYCDVLIEYGGYENVEELKKTTEASNKSYDKMTVAEQWDTVNWENLQGTWVGIDVLPDVKFTITGQQLTYFEEENWDRTTLIETNGKVSWHSRAYKGWTPVISFDDASGRNMLTLYADGIDGDYLYSWNLGTYHRISK